MDNTKITVNDIRLYTPEMYDNMLSVITKPVHRRRFIILFWSGMRYIEFQRFHSNPTWYDRSRNMIYLPKTAQKKAKRKQLERYIHPLPDMIGEIIAAFHQDPSPPSMQTWNENLIRWAQRMDLEPFTAINNDGTERETYGISAKSTRKSIESWMIVAGAKESAVYLRQGHDRFTSLNHYQGLPFTPDEITEIKRRLAGMI
jgi:hypothetical protein